MEAIIWKISFCFLLLVAPWKVEALFTQNYRLINDKTSATHQALFYTQTVDHFDVFNSNKTFQQRYYVNQDYWDPQAVPSGPIILYINGEGPVSGPPSDGEIVEIAKAHKAIIVTLEHRFYGLSNPFPDYRTENFVYLNTRQALEDLAQFVTDFRKQIAVTVGTEDIPIFTIGGSYSGALSAWFRLRYPHITVGSIASSGVVNAILDFTAFDEAVAGAAGKDCADAMRATTKMLEQNVLFGTPESRKETMAKFQAQEMTVDGDFFYMMADVMAESVQYGYQDYICEPLVASYQTYGTDQLIDTFANYTMGFWMGYFGRVSDYNTADLQKTTIDGHSAARQWWWQCCTELAYFQTAPVQGSIRSSIVNLDYFRTLCGNIFGVPVWPDTDATNRYYGGNQTAATNVYFANGSQDPWRTASVTSSLSDTEPAVVITCHNCGHCVDLGGCPGGCSDPDSYNRDVELIIQQASQWISNSQSKN